MSRAKASTFFIKINYQHETILYIDKKNIAYSQEKYCLWQNIEIKL